jgi:hypothetical protein
MLGMGHCQPRVSDNGCVEVSNDRSRVRVSRCLALPGLENLPFHDVHEETGNERKKTDILAMQRKAQK